MRGAQGYRKAKVLMGAMVIGGLMTGLIPQSVEANPTNCITGYVKTIDNDPLPGVEIICKNLNTSEEISATTNGNGYYFLDLDDFSDWDYGNEVQYFIDYEGFYICQPIFPLEIYAYPDNWYQFDLLAMPIDAGYDSFHLGTMTMGNHHLSDSKIILEVDNNDEVILACNAYGVDIFATNCYYDWGIYDVPQEGSLDVQYEFKLYYRIHKIGETEEDWILTDQTISTYTVYYHTYIHGNPKNVKLTLSRPIMEHYDLRCTMLAKYGGTQWAWPIVEDVENIIFKFTGPPQ